MNFKISNNLIKQSKTIFNRDEDLPFFIKRGKSQYIYDLDQNKYQDFYLNHGSLILGHAHPKVTKAIKNETSKGFQFSQPCNLELRLAKLIMECYPFIETIRFHLSKKEVLHEMIYSIKNYTGKERVLFIGTQYSQYFTKQDQNSIILSDFGLTVIKEFIKKNYSQIGGICLEPICTNPSLIIHDQVFWDEILKLCKEFNLVLLLDEDITAFRLGLSGGVGHFNIKSDLILLGNVIGGGFPLYAYAGKKDLLDKVGPDGLNHYYPLFYAAGIETIKLLKRLSPFLHFSHLTELLCSKVQSNKINIKGTNSIFTIQSKLDDNELFKALLENHFFFRRPLSNCHFLSSEHDEQGILKLIDFFNKKV